MCIHAKLLQVCLTLCNPVDQAGILEWVAMLSSRRSFRRRKGMSLTSPALAGGFFTTSATWEAPNNIWVL